MKTTKTIEEFTCDGCGKKIGAEEATSVIEWNIGYRGIDCPNNGRVVIQDYQSYGHDWNESNLCWECKRNFLEKALGIVNKKILEDEI